MLSYLRVPQMKKRRRTSQITHHVLIWCVHESPSTVFVSALSIFAWGDSSHTWGRVLVGTSSRDIEVVSAPVYDTLCIELWPENTYKVIVVVVYLPKALDGARTMRILLPLSLSHFFIPPFLFHHHPRPIPSRSILSELSSNLPAPTWNQILLF